MTTPEYLNVVESGHWGEVDWAVARAPVFNAFNGYMRIPDDHMLSGMSYDEINDLAYRNPPVGLHGGAYELTFARDGWIGFDTLHACDRWPEMPYSFEGSYPWTTDAVAECARVWARWISEYEEKGS